MKFINKDSLWITISNAIKLGFGFVLLHIIAGHVGS